MKKKQIVSPDSPKKSKQIKKKKVISKQSIEKTAEWKELKAQQKRWKNTHLTELFAKDSKRAEKFHIEDCGLLLDYSKNKIDASTMKLLFQLLQKADFKAKRAAMFNGKKINSTEGRAVLHPALRGAVSPDLSLDGKNISQLVKRSQAQIKKFVNDIRSQNLRGFSGKPFRYVVNIGIGGSDLGPHMVTEALSPFRDSFSPQIFFVSNVDGEHIHRTLTKVNIEETLFIIASKTFTTQETMTNAITARLAVLDYFLENKNAIGYHFAALSTNVQEAMAFGIKQDSIFGFWDWVGGRYSLWSAIGVSIALSVGYENFEELLEGAKEMDNHFLTQPLKNNMPVILALLSVWYNNFWGYETHAVLPYAQNLSLLPAYLQQAEMESNGKSVRLDGKNVKYQTSHILWGEAGTNGQHAFYQLIHQGTKIIPCDFIGGVFANHEVRDHHLKLVSNLLAQPEALMKGKNAGEVREELKQAGKTKEEIEALLPHKIFEGNRPSNMLLYQKLTPRVLGALLALYEHKIFTEGIVWNINSFDQWGVELGKKLAGTILSELKEGVQSELSSSPKNAQQEKNKNQTLKHDSSTAFLLDYIISGRKNL